MLVLIIEDDPIWSIKLQIIAEKAKLEIAQIAASIIEAQQILNNSTIELIIADIHLDNENVLELLTQKDYKNIPTILTTASESKDDFVKAKKLANCVFLVKPFHQHSLLSSINLLQKKCSATENKSSKEGSFRISLTELKSFYKLLGNDELIDIFELSQRESLILKKRWQDEKSFKAIGKDLKISGNRVHELYTKTLQRVKYKITINLPKYKDYLNSNNTTTNKHEKITVYDLNTTIESMEEINIKCKNALCNKDITTIRDLLQYTKKELSMFKKLGPLAVLQLENAMLERGFKLKG